MGKRSRESQQLRRSYKKRKKAVQCAENDSFPASPLSSESTPFPDPPTNTTARITMSSPPGPRYDSPPSTGSLASDSDTPSPLYSQGVSLSPSETDSDARKRRTDTRRTKIQGLDERSSTVSASCTSLMKELNETEKFPVIVHESKRKLEVHISDPEVSHFRGSEVLKLSMEEYVERLHAKEQKSKVVIKCLRDRVEYLQKEVNNVKQTSRIEKDKAVREVRRFWRDSILEGGSHGGKMVNAALNLKNKRK